MKLNKSTSPAQTSDEPKIFEYVCTAMGCEDKQPKFCGYSYRCPFCGEGHMELQEPPADEWDTRIGGIR